MANYEAVFESRHGNPRTRNRFFGYTKDEAIKQAKSMADKDGYTSIYMTTANGNLVGFWEKRGSRWYKEW